MSAPLWDWDELVQASGGTATAASASPVMGFSIDTRSLRAGEVFVALRDTRDGHDFVPAAFDRGAAAALVAGRYDAPSGTGPLIRVDDPLRALGSIGCAARARCHATVFAITGSVGKTGTKEMLRAVLQRLGSTHAPEKSFNNHWGVPLTLARMPQSSRFGVFEIGMNHPGEITPLARMVRPHVAIVTTVEPVHVAFFGSVEAIADAKSEIFDGLEAGGTAVLNRDNAHFERLKRAADAVGARVMSFGHGEGATVALRELVLDATGSSVAVELSGRLHRYRVGAPGAHLAQNSLAVVAALHAADLDGQLDEALSALAAVSAPPGRGERIHLDARDGGILLIDESYNANPTSVRAALATLATVPRTAFRRRIAVLGDMLELGDTAVALHRGLGEAIGSAEVDLVFAAGPHMRLLFEDLEPARQGAWAETSAGLAAPLADAVTGGDVVMIKGSLGSRMGPLVDLLKMRFAVAKRTNGDSIA